MIHNDRAAAAKVALGTEYTETIEVQSELDDRLKGKITYSLPNGKEQARIAVIQHDLREGRSLEALDPLSGGLIVMLAQLSVVVREAPSWWYRTEGIGKDTQQIAAPELIMDQALLWEIWGKFVAFRNTFPRGGSDGADRAPSAGTGTASAREATEPAPV